MLLLTLVANEFHTSMCSFMHTGNSHMHNMFLILPCEK